MLRLSALSCFVLFLSTFGYFSANAQVGRAAKRSMPIVFEANQGQMATEYRYRFHRDGADTFFMQDGMAVVLQGKSQQSMQIDFIGGNAAPKGAQPLSGHTNYFLGGDSTHWVKNVQTFSEVEYAELYRGISLGFYGNDSELEHDFRVAPGANPSQIVLKVGGTSSMIVQANGDLAMNSPSGTMTFRKPVAYQLTASGKEIVPASFNLKKNGEIHFDVGRYDPSLELVIDPVIVFSTYLAGTGNDQITAVATDTAGNILVTGYTTSTDFPTKNPVQSNLGGSGATNAFVTKVDPTGKTLIYSTYLGGSSSSFGDFGGAIAVDSLGNAIVVGTSSSRDFPRAGSISTTACLNNASCYFMASIKPDGSSLNYSGLVGGNEASYTNGVNGRIAVDASGNAYLAGITDDPNFYVTAGTLATRAYGYPYDEMFVLKVDPTGKLLYSTVIPGNASNNPSQSYTNAFLPTGIAVDNAGQVTVAGWGGLGLPTTSGVVASQFPANVNGSDSSAGIVLQLNTTASAVNFASYLPGTDSVGALAVDSSGNLWIAGATIETTLPVSANAYQKTPGTFTQLGSTPTAGYIMELSPSATNVLAATYLDGSGIGQNYESSSFSAIALDSQSNIFVGGTTSSMDFPLKDPLVTVLTSAGTIWGMVLAEMSPDLSSLKFGSFLNATDAVYGGSTFGGIGIDAQDHLVAAGVTYASDFPTTAGSFEPQLPTPASPGSTPPHSFITKIDMSTPAPAVCFDNRYLSFGNVNANTSGNATVHVLNCGNSPLDISSVTSSAPTVVAAQNCGSIAPGDVCPIQLTFTPVSSASTTGFITLSDNATTLPQTVSFGGQGIAPNISSQVNSVSFGHYLVGTQSNSYGLLITNKGQAALSITGVTVAGSSFSLANQSCTPHALSTNGFCSVILSFTPLSAGGLTGTVTISSNDPQTPQLIIPINGTGDASYATPSITSISAPTVLVNSSVRETLIGVNFYPQSVVQLNGVPLVTTFSSNTALQATIPVGAVTGLAELLLTVVNPQPVGGTSAGMVITPYQTLTINPSFLVFVPATGLIYAAIPSGSSTNPNTIIPIDPATGVTKTPISVGKSPSILAASSDGSYLYVANQTDLTVQRINLQTNAVERTFSYTPNLYCSGCLNIPATDLVTVPGSPQEVILSQGDWLTLYNDNGPVNHVPNDGICCNAVPDFGSIALAGNPLTVYGLPFLISDGIIQAAGVSSAGLSYTRPTTTNYGVNTTTGNQIISDGTLLYTSAGQIWDPVAKTQVGSFPVTTFNATSYPNTRNINFDTSLGEFYTVGEQQVGNTDAVVVSAYSLKNHALNSTLMFPQASYPEESSLVRWGTNGLAFIGPGAGLTDQEVYLLRTSITSGQANALVSWAPTSPLSFTYGTYLSTGILNASGSIAGAITYTATPNGGSPSPVTAATVLPAGSYVLTATFNPADAAHYSVLTQSVNVSVAPAPLTLKAVDAGRPYGATNPAFTATLSGLVNNDTLTPGGSSTATASSTVGTYSIVPSVSGNAAPNYTVTATNGVLTITQAGSITTLGASATSVGVGQKLTLTATVTASISGTPTGTVQFMNGSTILGTGSLAAGTAVFTTTSPPAGSYSLSAVFSGDANFTSSSSATVGVSIVTPDFSLSVSPSTLTIKQGSSGTATFTVTPVGGYSQTITFSCLGLPTGVACSFSPTSVTPSGSLVTSTLTVITTGSSAKSTTPFLLRRRRDDTLFAALVVGALLFPRRRKLFRALMISSFLAMLTATWGCSSSPNGSGSSGTGGSSTSVTPTGSYTVSVNAGVSGNTAHAGSFAIVITQ